LPAARLQRVFEGLTFERMTGLYQGTDGAFYVIEQAGRISVFQPAPDALANLILDITDRVSTQGNEEGLLGFALSPDFEVDRAFYVYYSAADPRRSVLSRFTVALSGGRAVAAGSEEVIFELQQPFANHNGGQIAFGPDGYLYVALGDGGSGNDPNNNAQNLGTLLGSILRIYVSRGGPGYDVPADNPFVGTQGARGEIWAYGFRNPWRFSFDRETGDLWAGDVGQSTREEVDFVVRGGNYGWREMEGFGCRGGGSGCNPADFLPPVFDYARGSGGTCSVTGGFVYRGTAIPGLRGAYVFTDYCSGVIYALRAVNGVLTEQGEIARTGFRVSTLAQDNEGELYVLQHAGAGGIYKLVP
jgi:glucose/arabinose dehydrogenase